MALQCPGEPYTITPQICRNRQAHAYAKCPDCPYRETVAAMAPPVRPARPEEPMVPSPPPLSFEVPVAAGLLALARRLYDYF